MSRCCEIAYSLVFFCMLSAFPARAQLPYSQNQLPAKKPVVLDESGIVEKLGAQLPLQEIRLRDESGQVRNLGEFFSRQKPVLLALVYYNCPSLCNIVLNNLLDTLKQMDWIPGREFDLLTVSIDPNENAELASEKKKNYLKNYARPKEQEQIATGWRFLTGEEQDLRRLSSTVGFGYQWDEATQQWAHAAALFFLSPQGKLTRLIYGVQYPAQQVKLALNEAANGTVGSIIDRVMFYCFRYDPQNRKYSLYVYRVVQASSLMMILLLGSTLYFTFRRTGRLRDLESLRGKQHG